MLDCTNCKLSACMSDDFRLADNTSTFWRNEYDKFNANSVIIHDFPDWKTPSTILQGWILYPAYISLNAFLCATERVF